MQMIQKETNHNPYAPSTTLSQTESNSKKRSKLGLLLRPVLGGAFLGSILFTLAKGSAHPVAIQIGMGMGGAVGMLIGLLKLRGKREAT